jgi:hypothetical protein
MLILNNIGVLSSKLVVSGKNFSLSLTETIL